MVVYGWRGERTGEDERRMKGIMVVVVNEKSGEDALKTPSRRKRINKIRGEVQFIWNPHVQSSLTFIGHFWAQGMPALVNKRQLDPFTCPKDSGTSLISPLNSIYAPGPARTCRIIMKLPISK